MATKPALLRYLLIGLLLLAQQAAFTHAIWHAYGKSPVARHAHGADGGAARNALPESVLCRFDVTFGQILGGGAQGAECCICEPHLGVEQVAQTQYLYSPPSSVSFFSRGPPVLL